MKFIRLTWLALILFGVLFLSHLPLKAQSESVQEVMVEGPVYALKEIDPPYMTATVVGIAMIQVQQMKNPSVEKKQRKRGEVVVEATVTQEGKMVNVKIIRSLGDAYDQEVMRVMEIMQSQTWEAGSKDGKPVHVQLELPFKFPIK